MRTFRLTLALSILLIVGGFICPPMGVFNQAQGLGKSIQLTLGLRINPFNVYQEKTLTRQWIECVVLLCYLLPA